MLEIEEFENSGFAVLPSFLDSAVVEQLTDGVEALTCGIETKHRGDATFGIRNLLNLAPAAKNLAESPEIRNLVDNIIGKKGRVVRGIFFDKTPEANWKVPFHQDLTIAVRAKVETVGFTNWTIKAGINHVQPPAAILERMLTVRIHLDDTDKNNGALRIVPQSHQNGRLSSQEAQNLKSKNGIVTCQVKRGGTMLMKPLLLHASSASIEPKRRRIIHLEFSAEHLPNNLEWFGS